MSKAIAVVPPAELAEGEAPKYRFIKKPSWKSIKKTAATTGSFLWKWKWPILAVIGVVGAYFFGAVVLWAIGRILWLFAVMIGSVLGTIVQLAIAVIVIPVLCLWASISHLFGGGELLVSYNFWPFASDKWSDWNSVLDWGSWKSEGVMVYVWGGLAGLILTYIIGRSIFRSLKTRAKEKQQLTAAALRKADEERQASLDASYADGKTAGIKEERAIVRVALLHAYKPKRSLPAIPEGHTRLFWITLRLQGVNAWPTSDRAIHWMDIEGPIPAHYIGAPVYQTVSSSEGDNLAFMGVVYKLDNQPTAPQAN